MRMSISSKASMVAEIRLLIVSFSRRSPAKYRTLPSSGRSPNSAHRLFSSTSANMTLAPCSAKCRPTASPIPLAEPVIMAVLPAILKDIYDPHHIVREPTHSSVSPSGPRWALCMQYLETGVPGNGLDRLERILKRGLIGQVPVCDQPKMPGRSQHFCRSSNKALPQSGLRLAPSVKRRVHHNRIHPMAGLEVGRIRPMKLRPRVCQVFLGAFKRHMIGLDQMQHIKSLTRGHLTGEITPTSPKIRHNPPQFRRQSLSQHLRCGIHAVRTEHARTRNKAIRYFCWGASKPIHELTAFKPKQASVRFGKTVQNFGPLAALFVKPIDAIGFLPINDDQIRTS
mmetsp:Transcript_422/g.1225  ORF Transcript_422/g.1225 Transcript_422/m.1225 type:complete len:340 (-) Transcript_422:1277-2296(-)